MPICEERLRAGVGPRPRRASSILILTDLLPRRICSPATLDAALDASQRAVELYRARESALDERRPVARARVVAAPPRAGGARRDRATRARRCDTAYGLLLEGIATLSDEGLRRSYLNKIDSHRDDRRGVDRRTRAAGASPPSGSAAHLAGEADLRAPFERLVDTGMRLNELRSVAELQEFLIDEVTELSGAERVLLVLEGADGPRDRRRAAADGRGCRRAAARVTPWLDEARRTRAVSLRHVPEGADALDQRSCLVAPLIAQQRLLGYCIVDIDGAFGRFHDTDRDLIAMLAAQAAVALDNAQLAQGLEAKVAERTAELQASNARTEQRAAELAVINSIQQGIAAELDFQAIVDLVGDKLRERLRHGHAGHRVARRGKRTRCICRTRTSTASGSTCRRSRSRTSDRPALARDHALAPSR